MTFVKFQPAKEFDKSFYGNCGKFYKDYPDLNLNTGFTFSPRVDISEDSNKFYFELELPGVKKDDLKISYQESVLTVSGEKKNTLKDQKEKELLRNERYFGTFKRIFTLPEGINPDSIEAKFEDGILAITVAKVEVKSPKEKTIEVK
ncbi:MAG TPA: Hsp20/alpha crystallin family protein [Ignavibacteriaceae bacterium]|nr:Hsp20/alpha crystallin family protein [Ignavibacteriaceae bacterium]